MTPDLWYYDTASGPVGPFTRGQIEALVGAATLSPDTLVRQSNLDPWVPAGEAFAPDSVLGAAVTQPLSWEAGRRVVEGQIPTDIGETSANDRYPDDEIGATSSPRRRLLASLSAHRVLVGSILAVCLAAAIWYAFLRGPDECVAVFESDFPPGNTFYGQVLAAESEEGLVRLSEAVRDGDAAFAAYIIGPGKEAGHSVLVYPAGTTGVVERVSFYDRLSDPYGAKIRLLEVRIEGGADDGRLVWLFRDTVDVPGCDYI